jgi:hypothetical protein
VVGEVPPPLGCRALLGGSPAAAPHLLAAPVCAHAREKRGSPAAGP